MTLLQLTLAEDGFAIWINPAEVAVIESIPVRWANDVYGARVRMRDGHAYLVWQSATLIAERVNEMTARPIPGKETS